MLKIRNNKINIRPVAHQGLWRRTSQAQMVSVTLEAVAARQRLADLPKTLTAKSRSQPDACHTYLRRGWLMILAYLPVRTTDILMAVQGVNKFNWTNFQEISKRFQEGFQEKCRTCMHCFGLLCNVPNLLVCLNIEQKNDIHNMGPWQR